MEFFRQANIDWMGKAKYFFVAFRIFAPGGIVACVFTTADYRMVLILKGVRWLRCASRSLPNVDVIRHDLAAQGLGQSSIQSIHDPSSPNANEIVIGLEEKGRVNRQLDFGKTAIIDALTQEFSAGRNGQAGF